MKKTMKRGLSILFVVALLASMLAMPVSAKKKDDWKFEFTGQHVFTDYLTRHGRWRTVYFRFKGTGIEEVVPIPCCHSKIGSVQYRNLSIKWLPAGYWCYGNIDVRGTLGGTGHVTLYFRGSSFMQRDILIK